MLCLLLLTPAAQAVVRQYGASLTQAAWLGTITNGQCVLSHPIPGFGEAVFVRGADRSISFLLRGHRGAASGRQAVLRARPPAWRKGLKVKELRTLEVGSHRVPIELAGEAAEELMAELENGYSPVFTFRQAPPGTREVEVRISAVNFRPALDEFLRCEKPPVVAQKAPVAGAKSGKGKTGAKGGKGAAVAGRAVEKGAIYFKSGSDELTKDARETLNELIYFMKVHPDVRTVLVTGYADTVGSSYESIKLSLSRARKLREYFISKGIPGYKLKTRFSGEYTPDGKQAPRRDRNLRMNIDLIK